MSVRNPLVALRRMSSAGRLPDALDMMQAEACEHLLRGTPENKEACELLANIRHRHSLIAVPTPRTDKNEIISVGRRGRGKIGYVYSAFARTLERELIAAKNDAHNYRVGYHIHSARADRAEAEVARLQARLNLRNEEARILSSDYSKPVKPRKKEGA